MSKGIASVHVRRQRGRLVVQGQGQTPRGQRFIRDTKELRVQKVSDKDFKTEMATAVDEIFAESLATR